MSRAEAIEIRTKQLNGIRVDAGELQIAVLVIARTVHEKPARKKRAARIPAAPSKLPGSGQDLAWAAQKECANRVLLAKLCKAWIERRDVAMDSLLNDVARNYQVPVYMLLGQPRPVQP